MITFIFSMIAIIHMMALFAYVAIVEKRMSKMQKEIDKIHRDIVDINLRKKVSL